MEPKEIEFTIAQPVHRTLQKQDSTISIFLRADKQF